MTKTLTEQWRDGTLPEGHYYFQYGKCAPFIKDSYTSEELKRCIDAENIKALAGVPTYAEFMDLMSNLEYIDKYRELVSKTNELKQDNKYLKSGIETRDKQIEQLEKKLDIATKALKEINKNYRFTVAQDVVYKALKEMEGVK